MLALIQFLAITAEDERNSGNQCPRVVISTSWVPNKLFSVPGRLKPQLDHIAASTEAEAIPNAVVG